MLSRRKFLVATPAALAVLSQGPRLLAQVAEGAPPVPPKIGRSTRTADLVSIPPGRLVAASPKVCKILQFTDLHFFNKTAAEDEMTIGDFHKHIDRHQPDLVVVSGDLWHDNPDGRGQRAVELCVKTFSAWGARWTMGWGDHDLLADSQPGRD